MNTQFQNKIYDTIVIGAGISGISAACHLKKYSPKADFLILETGLGGRLDATNIIPKKFLSIITSIGIDHEEFLGNTLKKITTEKLGIIKNTNNIIIAKQKQRSQKYSFNCRGRPPSYLQES